MPARQTSGNRPILSLMKHAGVTEKDVTWPRVHMDFDDGWQIYEVEFHVGWTEYNYDIDAVTGQILGYESDWGD